MTVHFLDIVELNHDSIENGCPVSELTLNAEIFPDQIVNGSLDSSALLVTLFFSTATALAGYLLYAVSSTPVMAKEKLSI